MINVRNVRHIAGYEVKLLLRNRVFLLLAFFVVVGTPVCLYFVQEKFFFWHQVALPCALPLSNALMFGCFQSLLVIFMACEWRTRERRTDSLQALRGRPFGNADYLAGKAYGMVVVMTLVGILAFLPMMIYHAFSEGLAFHGGYYLFYWVTLTLPALLFMVGLSLWICTCVPLSFLSMVILISILGVDLFGLSEWGHGVLDFMAVAVPNVFSEAVGHVGLESYLLQRLWIVLAGIAFLIFAVVAFSRLDNTPRTRGGWIITGVWFMFAAIVVGLLYEGRFVQERQLRKDYRTQCISYEGRQQADILRHSLVWIQTAGQMEVTDTLIVVNSSDRVSSELYFYLNPGLKVERIECGDELLHFRQNGLVTEVETALTAGEQKELVVQYSGHIDEQVCYLYTSDSLYDATAWSNSMLRYGKYKACVSDRYTFLIPECLWYPRAHVPYHSGGPLLVEREFSTFRLEVYHPQGTLVVSQGTGISRDNCTVFTNAHSLVGISLVVGVYERKQLRVDSLCCEIYFFDPEGDFISVLNGSATGIAEGVREVEECWKEMYGRTYPFTKIALIETPVSLCSYPVAGGYGSGFVQPELLFVPESWSRNSEIIPMKEYVEYCQKENPQAVATKEEAGCVKALYLRNFRDLKDEFPPMSFIDHLMRRQWFLQEVKNPWSITPMFTDDLGGLRSEEFPGIDVIVAQTAPEELKRLGLEVSKIGAPAVFQTLQYLTLNSLREAFADPKATDLLADILLQKGAHFRRYMNALVGKKAFQEFLNEWKEQHLFSVTDFQILAREIKERFGIEVEVVMRQLYEQKGLPVLWVQNLCQQAVGDSVFLVFDVWNPSELDGVLTCYIRPDIDFGFEEGESLLVPAGECLHLAVPLESQCTEVIIHTNLSANLPGGYSRYFSKNVEQVQKVPPIRQAFDTEEFGRKKGEIIVDNEDPGFRLVESKARKIVGKGELKDGYACSVDFLTGNFRGWVPSIYEHAWGGQLRSFYGKLVGNGDSKTEWTADLPEEGEYEVFVYYLGVRSRVQRLDSVMYCYDLEQGKLKAGIEMLIGKNTQECGIKIRANDGYEDDFYYQMRNRNADWIPIGRYRLEAGKVRLTLYDRGIPGRLIFADAVKWVRL